MQKILKFIFILLTINVFSQDPQTHYILENEIPSDVTKDYIGRDFVKMAPGFNSNPDANNHHVLAKTDPRIVFPPDEGDLTGGDPNNNAGGVVGSLPGNFMVSPSGSATYKIPIELPPGLSGMNPSLGFVYNSQSGNGLLGIGWSLSGLSSISRTGTTVYNDSYIDGIDFDENDQFMLDGQRLIAVNHEGTEFRTEIETFSKVVITASNSNGPLTFKVWTKDGKIFEFGGTENSRVLVGDEDNNVYAWKLNKISDHNGNYINYEYHDDYYGLRRHITKITYGGNTVNSLPSIYEVKFDYSHGRFDNDLKFVHGFRKILDYRLSSIEIRLFNQSLISKYELSYNSEFYSHIESITKSNKYGDKFNPTLFTWGQNNHLHEQEELLYNYVNTEKLFLDINGDGKTDMAELYWEFDSYDRKKHIDWKYRLRTDNGFSNQYSMTSPLNSYNFMVVSGDYNGDGMEDIVRFNYTNSSMTEIVMDLLLLSNGSGFDNYTISGKNFWKCEKPTIKVGDFNGDGIDEILLVQIGLDWLGDTPNTEIISLSSTAPYYNTVLNTRINFGNTNFDANKFHIGDFNADGKSDILAITEWGAPPGEPHVYKWYIFEVEFDTETCSIFAVDEGAPATYHRIFPGDFNADGNTDVLTYNTETGWKIRLFDGKNIWYNWAADLSGLYSVDPFGISGGLINEFWYNFSVADYNGDGKSDIAQFHLRESRDIADYDIFYCNGDNLHKFTGTTPYIGGFVSHGKDNEVRNNCYNYNDFNGDGKTDVYFKNGSYNDIIIKFDHNNNFNLINEITNGLGHRTKIIYDPLTNGSVYTKGSNAVYPLVDLQPPINVVSSVEIENGISGFIKIDHTYEGAIFNKEGKGFLGFLKTIKEVNPNTISTNKVENSYAINLSYFFRWLESTKLFTYTEDDDNELITETVNDQPIIKNYGDKRIFYYIPRSLKKIHHTGDVESNFISTTLTTRLYSEYDIIYGNLTSLITYSDPEEYELTTPTQTYDFYTSFDYSYQPLLSKWLIGLSDKVIIKKWNINDGIVDEQKTSYTYWPNSPMVHKISQLPNNNNEFLTTKTFTYQDYGNDCYGNASTLTVDAVNFQPPVQSKTTSFVYGYNNRYLVESKNTVDGVDYITSSTYYPETGLTKSTTAVDGLSTQYLYDGFGRLYKTIFPDGIQVVTKLFWSENHEDNPNNGLYYSWTQKSNENPVLLFSNKLKQNILSVSMDINENKVYSKTNYNNLGQVLETSNSYFSPSDILLTQYEYIASGAPKRVTNPIETIELQYNGRVTTTKNTTLNKETSEEINAIGLVKKVTDQGGIINYYYNSSGKIKSIISGELSITYSYDDAGFTKSMTDLNAGTIIYDYNPLGELCSQTNANEYTYNMEYDVLGRIKSKKLFGSPENDVQYTYCQEGSFGFGKLKSVSKANGILTEFTYDDLSRITDKTQTIESKSYTCHYDYYSVSKIRQKTWPSGFSINYHYKNGFLKDIEQTNTGTTLWRLQNINATGQILQYELGNGLITSKEFDQYGYPETISTSNQVQDLTYSFNASTGNLDWRKTTLYSSEGSYSLKEEFSYDHSKLNNRLETWMVNNGGDLNSIIYCDNGNFDSKSDIGTYKYNNLGNGPNAVGRIENPSASYLSYAKVNEQQISYNGFDKTNTIWQFNPDDLGQSSFLEITYGPEQSRRKSVLYKDDKLVKTKYFIGNSFEIEHNANGNVRQLHYINTGDGLFGIFEIEN